MPVSKNLRNNINKKKVEGLLVEILDGCPVHDKDVTLTYMNNSGIVKQAAKRDPHVSKYEAHHNL
jgi:hypothetical protein